MTSSSANKAEIDCYHGSRLAPVPRRVPTRLENKLLSVIAFNVSISGVQCNTSLLNLGSLRTSSSWLKRPWGMFQSKFAFRRGSSEGRKTQGAIRIDLPLRKQWSQ
jgi:hypothetical protein